MYLYISVCMCMYAFFGGGSSSNKKIGPSDSFLRLPEVFQINFPSKRISVLKQNAFVVVGFEHPSAPSYVPVCATEPRRLDIYTLKLTYL
jgi:hypothetical protein